jgi:hypothetical protein
MALSRSTFELILANRLPWAIALEKGQATIESPEESFQQFLSLYDGWKAN